MRDMRRGGGPRDPQPYGHGGGPRGGFGGRPGGPPPPPPPPPYGRLYSLFQKNTVRRSFLTGGRHCVMLGLKYADQI